MANCASVEIPITKICSVAGKIDSGGICSTTDGIKSDMTMEEFVVWLEAQDGKAAAVCESAQDYSKQKTALEKLCREAGSSCTFEMRKVLKSLP